MGAILGCCKRGEQAEGEGGSQYESLVTVKPPPVTLDHLVEGQEKMEGVPLFAPAKSDGEDAVSDPETLTDTELNLYASKLNGEEEESD